MIPKLDALHSLAYPLYYTRPLMAQHHCAVSLVPVVTEVYIGAADTRGDEANQDFVVPWPFHPYRLDLQGAAFLAQNGRLNPVRLPVRISIHCFLLIGP
ncbi:MAG: hypothetical protein ABSG44_16825 [Thermodesulfobacteriota bacterium]